MAKRPENPPKNGPEPIPTEADLAAAFAGDLPGLDCCLIEAGWTGLRAYTREQVAERLDLHPGALDLMTAIDPDGAGDLGGLPQKLPPGSVNPRAVEVFRQARAGKLPELRDAITRAGYLPNRATIQFSQDHLAAYFGVDARTVRRWIQDGLPSTSCPDGGRRYDAREVSFWRMTHAIRQVQKPREPGRGCHFEFERNDDDRTTRRPQR